MDVEANQNVGLFEKSVFEDKSPQKCVDVAILRIKYTGLFYRKLFVVRFMQVCVYGQVHSYRFAMIDFTHRHMSTSTYDKSLMRKTADSRL